MQTLHEYIGDTEDLVNIQLDTQRNLLITMDLCITAFNQVISVCTAISAFLAMNLVTDMPAPDDDPMDPETTDTNFLVVRAVLCCAVHTSAPHTCHAPVPSFPVLWLSCIRPCYAVCTETAVIVVAYQVLLMAPSAQQCVFMRTSCAPVSLSLPYQMGQQQTF